MLFDELDDDIKSELAGFVDDAKKAMKLTPVITRVLLEFSKKESAFASVATALDEYCTVIGMDEKEQVDMMLTLARARLNADDALVMSDVDKIRERVAKIDLSSVGSAEN